MFHFASLPPLSLYIHFPWCVRKCPYCDFNSHELKGELDETHYIDAVIVDLEQALPSVWGRNINSIFLGGGTPSLFSPESIERLLSALRARITIPPGIEITLEANPGTVEQGKFSEFRYAGINRLSIGVQSFESHKLQSLGRIHDGKEAITAVEAAHDADFENLNIDIMFALPDQSLHQALCDIRTAIDLEPSHISHYQLTIEPNTQFHQRPPSLPDEDIAWDIQTQSQELFCHRGYPQYEVSAYARPGKQCTHNLNYWHFGDYLGIGAGAHSKISNAQQQYITRLWNVKHPRAYLENAHTEQRIAGTRQLEFSEIGIEFMMNALRLTEGFPTRLFIEHAGVPISTITSQLRAAEKNGWIEWNIERIRPTTTGKRYLNDVLQLFLPEDKQVPKQNI